MKYTKIALVSALALGTLSACKPESAAPVTEPAAAPAEPQVPPALPPTDMEPSVTDPSSAPTRATDSPPAVTEDDEDTPHSGGDKVGKPANN